MIALLLWLIGATLMVYEITARHLWQDMVAAALGAVLVLWCVGGAALISLRNRGLVPRAKPRSLTPEMATKLADLARQQQQQPTGGAK